MNLTTWLLVGIGSFLFLYGVIKTPPSKRPTIIELTKLVDDRMVYLPELKIAYENYINRVEYLAKNTDKLCDLDPLRKIYLSNRVWNKQSPVVDILSLGILLRYKIFMDNLVFRQVEDEDAELFKLNQQIDSLNANTKDKRVRNFAKGLRKGAHMAYSYYIFSKLVAKYMEKTPYVIRFYLNQGRKMQDKFRQHQNDVNVRIDALLEGAEDEL